MSRFTSGLLASVFLLPSFAAAQDVSDDDLIIVTASPLERSIDEAITCLLYTSPSPRDS